MAGKFQPFKIINPTGKHTGTIFFFHGAGDTGPGICNWVKELTDNNFVFPHLKVIFPTAPKRPYKAFGGEMAHLWYNYSALGVENDEDRKNIPEICDELMSIIAEETQNVPSKRIILGGYSIGGAIALHLGYRYFPDVPGVFSLSSHIPQNSEFFNNVKYTDPNLFMSSGVDDDIIPPSWSKKTFERLQNSGVRGEFSTFDGKHELNKTELEDLIKWVFKVIPK